MATSVNIKDFGAHSIDEKNYTTFNSSSAINKAIQYASAHNITVVDFGSGRYYADRITLMSNISYVATNGATLIAAPTSQTNYAVLQGWQLSNISFNGLDINGNMNVIPGNTMSGHSLVKLIGCTNVTFQNCNLHDNWYLAIDLENGCSYITVKNNKIFNTDSGVIALGTPSNFITVDSNEIWGGTNQYSEPVSIFNDGAAGLSHDITITNNLLHDKKIANGIQLRNTEKVLINNNTI
jgi:parallel beta-helix repeat protein